MVEPSSHLSGTPRLELSLLTIPTTILICCPLQAILRILWRKAPTTAFWTLMVRIAWFSLPLFSGLVPTPAPMAPRAGWSRSPTTHIIKWCALVISSPPSPGGRLLFPACEISFCLNGSCRSGCLWGILFCWGLCFYRCWCWYWCFTFCRCFNGWGWC